ncbi:MAG: helix-turn-helix transcriptional regulator [Bacteroidota bacterium]
MNSYGDFFKAARQSKKLTLRQVEKVTGISNAYVSQLETNKVKHPSPNALYKLAELYGIPYEVLMEKVGYPVPNQEANKNREQTTFHRIGEVTDEEEEALLQYLSFIRAQKKRK